MYIVETKTGRKRQQLADEPSVPEHLRIRSIQDLRHHLQTAIEIEHSTIPAYLTALYSIQDAANQEPAAILRSVVMEEMLHMVLAANVLNAIDGHPSVNHPSFIPEYPTYLPHSNKAVLVNLEKFSPSALQTFLRIELPAKPHARPEGNDYQTLGQFYDAIELALIDLSHEGNIFSGDHRRQVTPAHYYGGGGEVIVVAGSMPDARHSALRALREIVGQGEGVHSSLFDGNHVKFGQEIELAHYFRFNQIQQGRYYKEDDTPRSGPSGEPLAVDWAAVHDIRPNPKMSDYPHGSELWEKSRNFNRAYTSLLNVLHAAFNGHPHQLLDAVPQMYELKYLATALMQMPLPEGKQMAGPSFEFVRDHRRGLTAAAAQ